MTPILLLSQARSLTRDGDGRRRREAAAISLRELALAINVTPSTLSRWETGRSRPRASAALRWAEALRSLLEPEAAMAATPDPNWPTAHTHTHDLETAHV